MIGFERAGEFSCKVRGTTAGECARQRRIEVDALAAACHRHSFQRHPEQDVAHEPGDLGALSEADLGSRVEVEY